jgi:hypothetical protein
VTDTLPDEQGLLATVGFQISAGLGSLRDEMRKMRADLQRSRAQVPKDRREVFYPFNTPNSQYPAAGNLILAIDGPQLGELWEVRQIIVGGSIVTQTPNGTAYVLTGIGITPDLSLAAARDVSLTPFPVKGFYSTGVFKLRPQEGIFIVITGGTPGVTYAAYTDVQVFPLTPKMATVNIE